MGRGGQKEVAVESLREVSESASRLVRLLGETHTEHEKFWILSWRFRLDVNKIPPKGWKLDKSLHFNIYLANIAVL